MKKGERVTHRGSTGLQEHPPRVADPSAKRVTNARAWVPPRRALGFAPGACGRHDARKRQERRPPDPTPPTSPHLVMARDIPRTFYRVKALLLPTAAPHHSHHRGSNRFGIPKHPCPAVVRSISQMLRSHCGSRSASHALLRYRSVNTVGPVEKVRHHVN